MTKPRRPSFADVLLGLLGNAVIQIVLGLAWLRARVTGSPWHG